MDAYMEDGCRFAHSADAREEFDRLANLFSLVVSLEKLENAYVNAPKEQMSTEKYEEECKDLLSKIKTLRNVCASVTDLDRFVAEHRINCSLALQRIRVGMPATSEHGTSKVNLRQTKIVAETTQHFITLLDSLKLNMTAVDELSPLLVELFVSLRLVESLPKDDEAIVKIQRWREKLEPMKASDSLSEEDARQLAFEVESAYNSFHRSLSADL